MDKSYYDMSYGEMEDESLKLDAAIAKGDTGAMMSQAMLCHRLGNSEGTRHYIKMAADAGHPLAIMQCDLTWDDTRKIAIVLDDKYPRTDVLSLNDTKLLDMMKDAGILNRLPGIDEEKRKDYLFAIK